MVTARDHHTDITGRVDVTDPDSVCAAVLEIFQGRYPNEDCRLITRLYADFGALYRGEFDGFCACDTSYHDIQHVLDVSLAMARLVDGYEINHTEDPLGVEMAIMGVALALFHDAGYVRRVSETDIKHGAVFTRIHVSRSGEFMAEYFPRIGKQSWVQSCEKLVHFTGYECQPEDIAVTDSKERIIGMLTGTADIMAQMADVAYLEKCRDRLFQEFEIGGVTKQFSADGVEYVVYGSPEELLLKTPAFIEHTIAVRLEDHFNGFYHQVAAHFNGHNPYMASLKKNCDHLKALIAQNDVSLLQGAAINP